MSSETGDNGVTPPTPRNTADCSARVKSLFLRPIRLRTVIIAFFMLGFGLGMLPSLVYPILPFKMRDQYDMEFLMLTYPGRLLGGGHCAPEEWVGPLNGIVAGAALAGFVWLAASLSAAWQRE